MSHPWLAKSARLMSEFIRTASGNIRAGMSASSGWDSGKLPALWDVIVLLLGSRMTNASALNWLVAMVFASLCLSTVSVAPQSASGIVGGAVEFVGGNVDNAGDVSDCNVNLLSFILGFVSYTVLSTPDRQACPSTPLILHGTDALTMAGMNVVASRFMVLHWAPLCPVYPWRKQ